MSRSSGILPAMERSTRRGMKSRGRLSPWITPRTVRPPCSHGISKLTSVPARALPTRMQVPRPRSPSTASRNTAGTADVSSAKSVPPPVILRISASVSAPRLSSACVAPSSRASASRLGSRSTAMIGSQPAIRAAINPARPTPPTPYTAIDCPAAGCITFSTAPSAGLQATAERTQHFDRRVAADLDDILGRGDGETRERGLLKEAGINRLTIAAHRDRAVGAAAARLELPARADKLIFGNEGTYPPFSVIDPSGRLTGFEPELAREMCKRMNAECDIVAMDFKALIPSLLAGKLDGVVSQITPTPDRVGHMLFSVVTIPYL